MKILIVAVFFPPQNTIGALRPYSWAKWWSLDGHDITILTTQKHKHYNDLILPNADFETISVEIPIQYSMAKSTETKHKIEVMKKNIGFLSIAKSIYSFINKTTGYSISNIFYDMWAKKAIKIIIPKIEKFDMVISTALPYSVHRIGLAIKRKYPQIKWIVDWRDLWTKNHIVHSIILCRPYEKYLEKLFHDNCDLITTVSDPLADVLRNMTKTSVETIYNGFDPDDYQQIKSRPRKDNNIFTIVYTGTIYKGFRDISPLFEAISSLKQTGLITPDNLSICFAGIDADVSDIAEKYNVSDFYSYLGLIPREDALQLQYDADAVLFIECSDPTLPGILTGKLFEYLYIARDILAIGVSDDTSAGKLIVDSKAGVCFGKNVEKIKDYLQNRIINGISSETKKDKDIINNFNRKIQAERMLKYIRNIKKE
jgi:hypothetical protein